jgi:hypothetical protein
MSPYDDPYSEKEYLEKYDTYAYILDAVLIVPAYLMADSVSPLLSLAFGAIGAIVSYFGSKHIYKHMPVLVDYISTDDLETNSLAGVNFKRLHEQEIRINRLKELHSNELHSAEVLKRSRRSLTLYLYGFVFIAIFCIAKIFF